jgi:hypothetical protein
MRCPSCRLPRQMLCSNCVSNSLRLARVRDVNHELFLRKAELCRNIDWELKANVSLLKFLKFTNQIKILLW